MSWQGVFDRGVTLRGAFDADVDRGGVFDAQLIVPISAGPSGAVLVAALSASGTIAAQLTTGIRLAAALTGSASVAAPLSTAIKLAAVLSGTATVAPTNLTTAIRLSAVLAGSATVAGAMTTGIALAAVLAGSATIAAPLTTAIRMAAALTGTATIAGAISTAIRLAAVLSGSATIAAALTTKIQLAAVLGGSATVAAPLSTAIRLSAVLAGSATLSIPGFTGGAAAIAAVLAASATMVAPSLVFYRPLFAALAASASVVASLTTVIRMSAILAGSAAIAGVLTTGIPLSSVLVATATLATPNLITRIELRALLAVAAIVVAELTTVSISRQPHLALLEIPGATFAELDTEPGASLVISTIADERTAFAEMDDGAAVALALFEPDDLPMAKKFYINDGDLGRPLRMRLVGGDGVPIDLTGKVVRFRMREDVVGGALKVDRNGVVVDGPTGRVRFDWQAADVNAPGQYRGQWIVDLGLPQEQTFPSAPAPDDYVRIVVQQSV